MIADRTRMDAYTAALEAVVRPGAVVLDLGAGPGIFALLACRLGARHVHALEPDTVIELARTLASAHDCQDRITFHQALSTRVDLPEPADVVVSDLRSVLPLFEHHIPSLVDVRERLLAPGGVLVPRTDTVWVALARAPELYRPFREPWAENRLGLDLTAGREPAVNRWVRVDAPADCLLAGPRLWARLDYATVGDPDVSGTLVWTMERSGTAHGLLAWFDAELAPGIGFSTAPGGPGTVYGQAFFPLAEPVALAEGDSVEVELRADLVGDDYMWRWNTVVREGGGLGPQVKARFAQSTFLGGVLSPAGLRKRAADFVPVLSPRARVDATILGLMDGTRSLEAVARAVAERFPERFRSWEDALGRVGELSERHAP